ncbi:hypothetical protein CTV95_19480 [Pectobacterium brasiliense]|nr:hypothetical protein CTV95_19480 [Pectobacterium brasiliense]
MCVGFPYSPQSLTDVSSWGFVRLPPACNSNYLGYSMAFITSPAVLTAVAVRLPDNPPRSAEISYQLCMILVINTNFPS